MLNLNVLEFDRIKLSERREFRAQPVGASGLGSEDRMFESSLHYKAKSYEPVI
jgi:hypothetical protein